MIKESCTFQKVTQNEIEHRSHECWYHIKATQDTECKSNKIFPQLKLEYHGGFFQESLLLYIICFNWQV